MVGMLLRRVTTQQSNLRPNFIQTNTTIHLKASFPCGLPCNFSSAPLPAFTEVPAVFDRIKQVASPEIIKKVNAVFVFDVEGEGKWHIDFTSDQVDIGEGPPTNKPDVTVVVSKQIFLKMFNRELKPATAFMSGQLKLSGDLSKALVLESVMKASRDEP